MPKPYYTLFNLATNSNTLLRPTLEQKDLGVWITISMTFSVHCHKSANKANQALGMIKRNFKYISKSSLMMLYKTFVRPHLEYCAPIWNPRYYKDIDTMEKVQRRATKLVPSISKLNYESRLHQLQLHSLYVTGFWKTDRIVTLGLFHFIGPANGYTHTLHIHTAIIRLG